MNNFILNLLKVAEVEKEFIVLVGILIVLVSMLFVLIRAYIGFKIKQEHCDGRFNAQDIKIEYIDKRAESAEKKSTESLDAVKRMEPKVNEMHKGYMDFLDDKYKNRNTADA